MGSYLSKPVTKKESSDEGNDKLTCGASSMQGWRDSQEDAHNCILDYDANTSFFAVYDGHGGREVAAYCADKLPAFIKQTAEYQAGKVEEALVSGYLGFDALLMQDDVLATLKELAGEAQEAAESEDDEENVNNLYEEAAMPIEQVIEKYTAKLANEAVRTLQKDDKLPISPCLKAKKDAGAASGSQAPDSSGDGVSSSSEADRKSAKVEESNGTTEAKPDSSDAKEATAVEDDEEKLPPTQNGEVSDSGEAEAKGDVSSSSAQENGGKGAVAGSKKGKGKAPLKPERSNTRPQRNATQLYKEWLDFGEESEDSDDADETFQGSNDSDTSDDETEGVNEAIPVDDSDESDDEDYEDDDEDDEHEGVDLDAFHSDRGPGFDSGCTAVVALLRGSQLLVANAGDSRCVVARAGRAVEMSFDHKPEDEPERARIKRAGGYVSSPDGRVNGGLNLSRAIGDHDYKRNKELTDKEQMITALPDVKTLTIQPGVDEFMVLACDGIWNSMSSQEVVDFVRPLIAKEEAEGEGRMSKVCEEMFDFCLAPNTYGDGTGCDNMTAIIVRFKGGLLKRVAECDEGVSGAKRVKTDDEQELDTTV